MAQIVCKNLTVGYGREAVVGGLNFEVNEGDYLCIVGENGSGKTTLMRTLLHLQPPIEGEVLLGDGLERNEIGYLPQKSSIQSDFPASVREIVLSGCQNRMGLRPFYSSKDKALAARTMERLGIADRAGVCYSELSGGQQQRVMLARALCATSKLLLMDEPMASLDAIVTAELYGIIEELNREGITIIMISHDIGAAVKYASHLLHIGDRVFFGKRDEYLASDLGSYFASGREPDSVRSREAASYGIGSERIFVNDKPAFIKEKDA